MRRAPEHPESWQAPTQKALLMPPYCWSQGLNEQRRICFVWRDGEAHDVEFADYH
jgi:hypothetical protein